MWVVDHFMAAREKVALQSERIAKAIKDLNPDCIVVFDENAGVNRIRFHIEMKSSSHIFLSAFPQFHVSQIADMSDEQLKQTMQALIADRSLACGKRN